VVTTKQKSPQKTPLDGVLRTAELLLAARQHERAGRVREAMDCCMAAVAEAAWCGAWAAQAVGLRRLGALHHHRNELAAARESWRTSVEVAMRAGESAIAVEALISLGNVELALGNFAMARDAYREGLAALGEDHQALRARIERDLASLAEMEAKREATRAA
jgi:tetratricopeptide (TPR) repeat protein